MKDVTISQINELAMLYFWIIFFGTIFMFIAIDVYKKLKKFILSVGKRIKNNKK